MAHGSETSNPTPSDTVLHSSLATPPKPTTEDQVLKRLSLWGAFSPKPSHPLYHYNYILVAEPAEVK